MFVKSFCVCIMVGSLTVFPAYAEEIPSVTVSVPEEIQVLSIDGQEQNSTFFGSRHHTQTLSIGEHVLSVRYSQLFNLNAEEHDIIKSKPLAIRFTAQANKSYQLIAHAPKRYEDAKLFAKQPDIRLVDNNTGTSQQAVAIGSYAEASLVDSISKAFQNSEDKTPPTATTNLALLQALWTRSTAQERQDFATWLARQTAKP